MANICTTEYALFGEKEKVVKLFNDLKEVLDTNETEQGNPFTFLGSSYRLSNIRKSLLSEVKEELPVNGEISSIEEDINLYNNTMKAIRLSTETAWCACSELMDKIAEKYDLQLFYYSEEPGFGIFETNDVDGHFFPYRYMINCDKDGSEYYESFDQVADAIENMTGVRLDNISEANDKLSTFNNDDSFLIINEISVV